MAVGCDALVGIREGVPATTGLDSGSDGSVTVIDSSPGADGTMTVIDSSPGTDSTMTGTDSGPGSDGAIVTDSSPSSDGAIVTDSSPGADGTMTVADSGPGADSAMQSTDSGGDSGGDSGASGFIPVSCAVSSATLVDDLGVDDAGLGTTFNNQMWIVPGQEGDGVYIVTTASNQYNSFTLYQASFQGRTTMATQLASSPMGDVRIIDVEPNLQGGQSVLASYQDDAGLVGLQLVPLPTVLGANPPGLPTYITPGFFPAMMAFPNGGTFAPVANGVDWIVDIKNQNAGTQTLYSGGTAAPDAGQELLLATNSQLNGAVPFIATGSTLYAFVQGLGDGGGSSNSSSVLSYPSTFDMPPTVSPVGSTSAFSVVIAAHPSVTSPGNVLVQAVNVDFSAGSAQVYAATTPPARLPALSIGAAPFTMGTTLPISDISFNAGSQVWEGDQLLLAGAGGANPDALMFMWLDPGGFAATHGVLLTRQNPIESTAIGSNSSPPVVEGFGSFFIAWTERLSAGGTHDQLWAAKVLCTR